MMIMPLVLAGKNSYDKDSFAQLNIGANKKVVPYVLEEMELSGSQRVSIARLAKELGLEAGIHLDDHLVMTTRSRLLSLGIFKSVILLMKKGSKKGLAKLIIEVEDDLSVLTDWALGGTLALTQSEQQAASGSPNTAPISYKFELVGRNFFRSLHRGALMFDIDSKGTLRKGRIAYGLPPFTQEDTQFDTDLSITNTRYHFLDTLGFGAKAQSLWTRSWEDYAKLSYGAAMYVNEKEYNIPSFPRSVAGPKIALNKETRLHSFIPGAGYSLGASILISVAKIYQSILELSIARTVNLFPGSLLTVSSEILGVGIKNYAIRSEARFDFPFLDLKTSTSNAEIFLKLRGGLDRLENGQLIGSAAIIGLRFHSSGFIAELGIQLTRSPEELSPFLIQSRDRR